MKNSVISRHRDSAYTTTSTATSKRSKQQYAERKFSGGLGRRAAFGHCADCGDALPDITDLVCASCRRHPKNANPDFRERAAGHRARISDLFAGVHGPESLDDVNKKFKALQKRKVKAA